MEDVQNILRSIRLALSQGGATHAFTCFGGIPDSSDGKESACKCQRPGISPWVGKIPWRRAWQHTPVFLPGEPHGQRSLARYSPWGHKESDMTE